MQDVKLRFKDFEKGWCKRIKKLLEKNDGGANNQQFEMPKCGFAAVCGDCYKNYGGWCRKHGGWVDADKWACPDFEPDFE